MQTTWSAWWRARTGAHRCLGVSAFSSAVRCARFLDSALSYRTEQDVLSATHWNFSSQLGLRFQSPQFPAIFELSARHWSNGGVRTPNRGQDFTILTVRFDR